MAVIGYSTDNSGAAGSQEGGKEGGEKEEGMREGGGQEGKEVAGSNTLQESRWCFNVSCSFLPSVVLRNNCQPDTYNCS